MKKIDINEIDVRTSYIKNEQGITIGMKNSIVDSLKLLAEKINEIIDFLHPQSKEEK